MSDASTYPVTFPYGVTTPPYGTPTNPYHRGDDRAMPIGTPVLVNGQQIGLSGNTGWVTGPHLHIGRFVNGKDTNPNGQGFTLNNPKQYDTGYDATDGNYVRLIDAQGTLWVYLHLSKIGGDMPITVDQVDKLIKMGLNREPTQEELANKTYQDNPGLAIDTFWNNGGKTNYETPPVTGFDQYNGPELFVKKA